MPDSAKKEVIDEIDALIQQAEEEIRIYKFKKAFDILKKAEKISIDNNQIID